MKILHVVSSVHKAGGGTSEVIPRLCRALQECGNRVTLACLSSSEISDSAKDAIAAGVEFVTYVRWQRVPKLGLSLALRHRLKTLVSDADIVHLHGLWQAPCWYAAAECLRQGKPYVMMPHGFIEPERLKISKWKKRIIGALFDRRYLGKANALVATAESEVEGFRAFGLTNPVQVMPIGLDMERFNSKSNAEIAERDQSTLGLGLQTSAKKKLLFFSRVTPIKGLDMLIEAWSHIYTHFPDWQLVITGPDDRGYTKELQSLIQTTNPPNFQTSNSPNFQTSITFTGPVYGDAKYDALRSADAFVLPTRSENWSIAVAEAMASGLPVVCTKGAPWSCIAECDAGRWVDISTDAIAAGLEQVLSASEEERFRMGQNGREWVARNLSWARIANDMCAFYKGMIRV